jgi:hypothetical protein
MKPVSLFYLAVGLMIIALSVPILSIKLYLIDAVFGIFILSQKVYWSRKILKYTVSILILICFYNLSLDVIGKLSLVSLSEYYVLPNIFQFIGMVILPITVLWLMYAVSSSMGSRRL